MQLTNQQIEQFRDTIYDYYHSHGRDLPWRNTTNPYHIVVSEVMLQQTQVSRVLIKYPEFLQAFPNFQILARTEASEVLRVWQGMGYNRRALNLKRLAEMVIKEYSGDLPQDPALLQKLPGIGAATANSIAAFACNYSSVFIETNIRRVFIHQFFKDHNAVSDKEILPLVEQTVDKENAREWYWALMDYGSWLAKQLPNPNRRSKHYTIQSTFEGSNRQLRGQILKLLLKKDQTVTELIKELHIEKEKLVNCLQQLEADGFLLQNGPKVWLQK
jgi:A/G-specific adenine glycosylase